MLELVVVGALLVDGAIVVVFAVGLKVIGADVVVVVTGISVT